MKRVSNWKSNAAVLACAGLLVLAAQTAGAPAQDRIDEIDQSAAETQSQGFPPDGGDRDRQYDQPSDRFDEQSYQESGRFDDRPLPPGRQSQSDSYGDQYQQNEARGGLGVVLRETDGRGARVQDVYQDSPAAQAGLRRGDQIIEIDGRPIRTVRELQLRVAQRDPGSRIEIVVLRNGREQTLDARLESRQEAFGGQNRQQFAQRQGQGWQDSRIENRLLALERQIQQLLSDVREIRNQAGYEAPQSRQTFRPEMEAQQSFQSQSSRNFDGQRSQSDRGENYPSDDYRDNQDRSDY
jgi:hypothetical protein